MYVLLPGRDSMQASYINNLTFKLPGFYLKCRAWFMKNGLLERKKDKIMKQTAFCGE
jgi:hypothetical protein